MDLVERQGLDWPLFDWRVSQKSESDERGGRADAPGGVVDEVNGSSDEA
jgi:hypothetical protein